MKQKTFIISLIFMIILGSFVIAGNIIPVYIRGRTAETTYIFTFNFTSDSSCNNVLKSVERTITTDINGIGFASLDISDLTTPPSYMCEYQDNVLIAAHIWNNVLTRNITANLFGDGTNYYTILQLALDSNASTGCDDGRFVLDGDGICINFNDTVRKLFSEEQIVYNASSINTEVGTLDDGNLSSIQNLADGNSYNVSEVSGVPGFLIYINFTNINNFNTVALRGRYEGGGGHTLALELYRIGVGWEEREEITDQTDFGVTTFPVFIGSNFINTTVGNGTVQFRINHDDSGIIAHDYFLDVVYIGQSPGLVSGGDLADLTGRDNACVLLPDVFCRDGSKAMTGELNSSDYNISVNMVKIKSGNTNALILDADNSEHSAERTLQFDLSNADRKLKVYADVTLDQDLSTSSDVIFNKVTTGSIDTGEGNNELYDMNQNVLTTSTPQFDKLGLGVAVGASVWERMNIEFARANNFGGWYVENTESDGITRFSVGMDHLDGTKGVLFQYDNEDGRALILNRKATVGTMELLTTGGGVKVWNDGNVQLSDTYSNDIGTERPVLINASGDLGYDSSSKRFKENIVNLPDEISSKVYDLKAYQYDKIEGKKDLIGMTAEDVAELFPQCVSYTREEIKGEVCLAPDDCSYGNIGYKLAINKTTGKPIPESINYACLVTPLVQEVQQLEERIESLENQGTGAEVFKGNSKGIPLDRWLTTLLN